MEELVVCKYLQGKELLLGFNYSGLAYPSGPQAEQALCVFQQ
jgi:hypothetical protein